MATASNNGLLPIANGQPGGQGGYSQVSPMFSAYYNAAQAPSGNNVLGYNYGAGRMMPGGVSGTNSAVPTAPTGGSLSLSSPGSPRTVGAGYNASANPNSYNYGNHTTGYGSPATGAGGQNQYTQQQNFGPPVAANPGTPAAPHYNPQGPLASPNAHAIPAQVHANSSGQIQGSTQPVNQSDALSQLQALNRPPFMGGGNPPRQTGPGIGDGSGIYENPIAPPRPGPPIKPGPPAWGNPVTDTGKPLPHPPGKKPPAKPPSALDKWLAGDTTYQQQLAEFNQEKQAYNQNYTNTKDQIGQNFNSTQRSMNNQANLDRMNQQYDFAGRGVLSSGAYATALDQYNTQFQNNIANLVQGENQQNTTNNTNLNNFLRQLTLQQDAAKQDAIARRAALLGITG